MTLVIDRRSSVITMKQGKILQSNHVVLIFMLLFIYSFGHLRVAHHAKMYLMCYHLTKLLCC